MSAFKNHSGFIEELLADLPKSTEEQRILWADKIISENIRLEELSQVIFREKKVVTRFLWLLSRIGMTNQKKLFDALPFLLKLTEEFDPEYRKAFANYWLIAGIPPENEAEAIDLSFQWLLSAETNVTIKSRAVFVLFRLTNKYPELKNELKWCLLDQKDKYSKDFQKRADKILTELDRATDKDAGFH